jgi:uncharacterized protein (TIGR02145 family)
MYRLKIIFIFSLLSLYSIQAQKVSNVSNRQEQSTIIVSYDLETKIPCKIALYVSTNGGTTWQGPLKKVIGDIGANVSSGNKNIIWNVLEEFDELKGTNIVFQIKAEINTDTVEIGNQIWMNKNLNVSTYRNGDIIPEIKDPSLFFKMTTGAWCYYNNDLENGKIYGKLYNWYAINDSRGIAPKGFHIPTDKDWDKLLKKLGRNGFTDAKLKENGADNNGFNRQLGGHLSSNGFFGVGVDGYFWSSSKIHNNLLANYRHLISGSNELIDSYYNKSAGFSVRCIKD